MKQSSPRGPWLSSAPPQILHKLGHRVLKNVVENGYPGPVFPIHPTAPSVLDLGILRAETMEQLFDYAMAFAYQPLIPGNRIAIVTNAGGPGIICTDAAEHSGLVVSRFDPATIKRLQQELPPTANVFNPIDVIGDARADRYEIALRAALADPNVDGVMVSCQLSVVSCAATDN